MKNIRLKGLLYSCVVLLSVFFSTHASACPIGAIVSVEFNPQEFGTADIIDGCGLEVHITGSTSFDPNADPVLKIFTTNGTGPFFTLYETITNNGPTAWTDWHEELLVPDGSGGWIPSAADTGGAGGDGLYFDGTYLNSPGGTVQGGFGNDMADIFFDSPVLPGQSINITKYIAVPFGMTEFAIAEYPTAVPVPAAVWLFGSGLLGLVGIARRKKAA